MVTRQQVAIVAGCSVDFVSNTVNRGVMTTKLPATTSGVARDFNRANTLEIAFVVALTDIGHSPVDASAIASLWLAEEARGRLAPWWVENCKTREGTFLSTAADTMTVASLASEIVIADDLGEGALVTENDFGDGLAEVKPATRIGVIHVAGIVEQVDALFKRARQ